MMLLLKAEVSRREPREYALTTQGRQVGVLRAGVLIFSGYESLEAARAAAEEALPILAHWQASRWRAEQLATLRGQPDLELRVGSTVVGTLMRPGDAPDVHSCAFALRIPNDLWVATGLGLAQRIYSALTRSVVTA